MDLQAQINGFAERQGWPLNRSRCLLAVSGGIDSMVMAHLFKACNWPFAVAHCNFQLRGEESEADSAFVLAAAEDWQVECFINAFETEAYAVDMGISIQMAARELRYAWFKELKQVHGFDYIAVAHHADDQTETILLNWVRGAGLRGLGGMKPERAPGVIRPLLYTPRAVIELYARTQGIEWREDSSNIEDDYTRNFLRHEVIPHLLRLNPALLETTGRNATRMRASAVLLDEMLFNWLRTNSHWRHDDQWTLPSKALFACKNPIFTLQMLLEPYGFSEENCRQLVEALQQQPGLRLESEGIVALADRDALIVAPAHEPMPTLMMQADDLMIGLPDGFRLFKTQAMPEEPFPDGRHSIVVLGDKLQWPLTIRPWQSGDFFLPFGMDGRSQKLQDFFTNQKLPRTEKDRVWLLVNGNGDIIWVIGFRGDERFRVLPDTPNRIKFTVVPTT